MKPTGPKAGVCPAAEVVGVFFTFSFSLPSAFFFFFSFLNVSARQKLFPAPPGRVLLLSPLGPPPPLLFYVLFFSNGKQICIVLSFRSLLPLQISPSLPLELHGNLCFYVLQPLILVEMRFFDTLHYHPHGYRGYAFTFSLLSPYRCITVSRSY